MSGSTRSNGANGQFAGVNATVPANAWQTLTWEVKGITSGCSSTTPCSLLEAEDRTISHAGKVGLWTKADSVTYFDDLKALRLPRCLRRGE